MTDAVTTEQPVVFVKPADLQSLEQRLSDQISRTGGEIKNLQEQISSTRQDIQQIRAHQDAQDKRTAALETEIRPAIQDIKSSSNRIDGTLNELRTLLERDRKTVDDHTASIQQMRAQQGSTIEKLSIVDADVSDLRTRLSDVVTPMSHMVMGGNGTPSLLQRLDNIRQDMERDRAQFYQKLTHLEEDVKPVIQTVNAWNTAITGIVNFLKTRRGWTFIAGIAFIVIELFSKIDLVSVVKTFIQIIGG